MSEYIIERVDSINIMHSGDFDFIEMCNGRLVQVFEFGKEINNNG